MKIISPSVLTNFHCMWTDDPKKVIFEFEVLCKSYDYFQYPQKLNLFLATLNDGALRWFMGLGTNYVISWDAMEKTFSRKM